MQQWGRPPSDPRNGVPEQEGEESIDRSHSAAPAPAASPPIRHADRQVVHIPLLVHTGETNISGRTDNLSSGGLRVIMETGLRPGSPLELRCTFGEVCHLNLAGMVAYCLPMTDHDCHRFAVGIRFIAVRAWERQILASAIQELHLSEETQQRSFFHLYVAHDTLAGEAASITVRPVSDDTGSRQATLGDEEEDKLTARDLLPKLKRTSYSSTAAKIRRDWLSQKCNAPLHHIGVYTESPENLRGNVEHFIGSAQIPLGVAGPLRINGQFARGNFYVPMATTEGALVYTCSESMLLMSLAGGAQTALLTDHLHISPLFVFDSVRSAQRFSQWVQSNFVRIKQYAETATRHGELVALEPQIFDRNVVVKFVYSTGDAMGINMVTFATEEACKYIVRAAKPKRFYLQPNFSSIKKVTAHNFIAGYGKTVIAEVTIPAPLVKRAFHITPQAIVDFYHAVRLCTAHVGMVGINGHTANMLAAVFTACGQDIACVVDSYVSVTNFEVTEDQGLYVSLKLPSLLVGTVGGGTHLATQRECLQLLGCHGPGKAKKFSEIVAAATLAGEIGICARVANGTFANAHKKYGRRHPPEVVPTSSVVDPLNSRTPGV